jgi:hypothetical protein
MLRAVVLVLEKHSTIKPILKRASYQFSQFLATIPLSPMIPILRHGLHIVEYVQFAKADWVAEANTLYA